MDSTIQLQKHSKNLVLIEIRFVLRRIRPGFRDLNLILHRHRFGSRYTKLTSRRCRRQHDDPDVQNCMDNCPILLQSQVF
ncbi:unnamed protein product [Amoebophrya sp. A120]|nr:unnamed protein product [Amoebophrya sp. A120]|eukprot:GSA120T00024183001.1